jgi:hypothetical protein
MVIFLAKCFKYNIKLDNLIIIQVFFITNVRNSTFKISSSFFLDFTLQPKTNNVVSIIAMVKNCTSYKF